MKLTTTILNTVPAQLAAEVAFLVESDIFKHLAESYDEVMKQAVVTGAAKTNEYYFEEAARHPTDYNLNKVYELFVANHVDLYRNEEEKYGVARFHFLDSNHLEVNAKEVLELHGEAKANGENTQDIHKVVNGRYIATQAGICDLDEKTFTVVMPLVMADLLVQVTVDNMPGLLSKLEAFPEVKARVEALHA